MSGRNMTQEELNKEMEELERMVDEEDELRKELEELEMDTKKEMPQEE